MANLQKVIKVTQAQYNTLASGGTVGTYTGLNDNYIYLVEDPLEKLPLIEIPRNGDIMLSELPTGSFALSGMDNDTWICTKTPILLISHANGYRFIAHNATNYCTGTCSVTDAQNLSIISILNGNEDNFPVTPYSIPDATTSQKGVVEIMTDEEMDAQTGGISPAANVNPIVDLVYPVGAIYISTTDSTVAAVQARFVGTTWVKIKDRFLLADGDYYNAGDSGGSSTHTHSSGTLRAQLAMGDSVTYANMISGSGYWTNTAITNQNMVTGSWAPSLGVGMEGSTASGSNMPPYYVVHMYRRTA